MVNLVGSPGQYRLRAFSIDSKGSGTFFPEIADGPLVSLGRWSEVRVEANVNSKQVRVYLDGKLASSGPYMGKAGLAGAHMGLYTNRLMKRATVFNDNFEIEVYKN
jgi:hypothetical protein